MNTLVVITGPTAVGKTDLCMKLAESLSIPIINADSRQLYHDLKIGTAAPTEQQLQQVRHYFVGTLGLDDYYSASMYEQQVMELLPTLFAESRYALMSGGSMMYIDAVCNGIDDIPTVDDHTRLTMKQRLANEGLEALCEELRRLDPEHYELVDRKNPRRVVHALEICHATGRTYTSFRLNQRKSRPFRIVKIGLNRPRTEIYDRINRRVDQMMADGFLEEARHLYQLYKLKTVGDSSPLLLEGQGETPNSLNTVGYKELFAYFDGVWPLDEAVERIKGNTRRYARKQLTWFKRDPEVRWFSPDAINEIIDYVTHLE